jgi:hypothetical protein
MQLATILYSIGKASKKQIIKIDDKTFFKHFNISCPSNSQVNDKVT